jgi:hypothetical protein
MPLENSLGSRSAYPWFRVLIAVAFGTLSGVALWYIWIGVGAALIPQSSQPNGWVRNFLRYFVPLAALASLLGPGAVVAVLLRARWGAPAAVAAILDAALLLLTSHPLSLVIGDARSTGTVAISVVATLVAAGVIGIAGGIVGSWLQRRLSEKTGRLRDQSDGA